MTPSTRWGAVATLLLAAIIVALQIGKAAIALPVLQRELMLTLAMASWIIGAYGLLGAVAGLPAGILSSLFTARRAAIAGLLTAGIGSLAGAFATDGVLLIATRAVEGCGFLIASMAIPRLLRLVTAPKDIDTVLPLFGAYLPTGSVLMLLAGPHLLAFGWQALWVVNGIIALGGGMMLMVLRVDEPNVAGNAGGALVPNIRTALAAPGPILLALSFGAYTFLYMALAGLLPSLLVGRLGMSISAAGTITAITLVINAIGNMSAGALLRLGVPTWAITAFAFSFMGCAGFGIFSDGLPVAAVAALAAVSLGLTGLIPGSIHAAAPKLTSSSAVLAIILGVINQATNLGNLVGPTATALVVDTYGWSRVPFLFAAVAFAGVALAFGLRIVLRRQS